MNIFHTDYSRLALWSHTDLSYMQQDPLLEEFMAYSPDISRFPQIIKTRKAFSSDRELLVRVLQKQYDQLGITLPVKDEVLLSENTFTITTAHQPALLTGPLYHIYKIASTIHLANTLNQSIEGSTIIPLFIVSGEDHDWEEINHLHLFGRKYQWERSAAGPCGRLSLDGLDDLIKSVEDVFAKSPHFNAIREMLKNAYDKATDYSRFHQLLVHALFGQHGLIVLNMDDVELKGAFVPLMKKEITEKFSSAYVPATQSALEAKGFKPQAFCRPVNLFYMSDQRRERIEPSGNGFLKVEGGTINTAAELIAELETHPDRFSPNVIMRPLYQELILPNLAYVGGGGEIAYWLERKSQFKAAGIHYPMLVRRNSVLQIDEASAATMHKADLNWEDILMESDALVRKYLKTHSQGDLEFDAELKMVSNAYTLLAEKAAKIDPTLAKAILAEETKQAKLFMQLGSRLIRAEKQHQETDIKRIQKLKEKLFPANGLQERHENFLSFFAQYGPAWIEAMINTCDSFNKKFTVLELP